MGVRGVRRPSGGVRGFGRFGWEKVAQVAGTLDVPDNDKKDCVYTAQEHRVPYRAGRRTSDAYRAGVRRYVPDATIRV